MNSVRSKEQHAQAEIGDFSTATSAEERSIPYKRAQEGTRGQNGKDAMGESSTREGGQTEIKGRRASDMADRIMFPSVRRSRSG
jgi:hypothetical protein